MLQFFQQFFQLGQGFDFIVRLDVAAICMAGIDPDRGNTRIDTALDIGTEAVATMMALAGSKPGIWAKQASK